jgi:hypothetical protein
MELVEYLELSRKVVESQYAASSPAKVKPEERKASWFSFLQCNWAIG